MTTIFKNYSEFLSRADKNVNGVSQEFADENPEFEKENETNKSCWNCSGCSDCSRCSDLKNASPIEQSEKENAGFKVPKIENIHQSVLRAASRPDATNLVQKSPFRQFLFTSQTKMQ